MEKKFRRVLVPSYMKQFACIGTKCEDNCCCGGWAINIDKKTYMKYQKLEDPELKALLNKQIKKREGPVSSEVPVTEETYALLQLDDRGCCIFLDECKNCGLQKKLGADYLSNVCMTYPRHTNIVKGRLEKSASVSCPEIARLALLDAEGISFEEIFEPEDTRYIIDRSLDADKPGTLEYYFWDLRIFIIELLQDKKYTLTERLIILGLFIKKLQDCIEAKNLKGIPGIISAYKESVNKGSYKNSFDGISPQQFIMVRIIKEMLDERSFMGLKNARYVDCANQMIQGLGYTEDWDLGKVVGNYKDAYENYYAPFMSEHEYILENYLVNRVFGELFPINGTTPVFYIYSVLIARYAMIKMILIGMSRYHKGLDKETALKLIQSFSHTVDHSPVYIKHILELLGKNNMLTMAYMAILIKD